MENKKEKKVFKQIIVIIAILSTYLMAFLLGRITNKLTLDVDNKPKDDDASVIIPTEDLTHSSNANGNEENAKDSKDQDIVETQKPGEEADIVIILWEGNKKWEQLENLNIFKSNFYQKDYENKIAPGFYGTYEFAIENNCDKPVRYILSFKEENPDNVNMVYTVLQENVYVLGNDTHSVYINNVKLEETTIPANSKILYKLNWKWEDTSYDTQIGQKDNANYELSINLQATMEE